MEEKKNIPQNLNPIQTSIKVNAPIDQVWKVITTPDDMRQWFFDIDLNALRDGDAFQFNANIAEKDVLHECLVLEMDEPSQFRHTWAYPNLSQGSSTVNWDLEENGNFTEIIVTHESVHELLDSGLPLTTPIFEKIWKDILEHRLKPYIENL